MKHTKKEAMTYHVITPDIFTVNHFMTEKECQDWIAFSEKKGYETAKISVGREQVLNTKIRNNERLIYDDIDLARELWERVKEFIPAETDFGYAIGLNERFRFYKYFPKQQFKPHKDGSFIRNIHEWSSYTFMIYLNEAMTGGETKFTHHSINPKTGTALIFRHSLVHEGCPVIEGIKYVLRTDVMYRRKGK